MVLWIEETIYVHLFYIENWTVCTKKTKKDSHVKRDGELGRWEREESRNGKGKTPFTVKISLSIQNKYRYEIDRQITYFSLNEKNVWF